MRKRPRSTPMDRGQVQGLEALKSNRKLLYRLYTKTMGPVVRLGSQGILPILS